MIKHLHCVNSVLNKDPFIYLYFYISLFFLHPRHPPAHPQESLPFSIVASLSLLALSRLERGKQHGKESQKMKHTKASDNG